MLQLALARRIYRPLNNQRYLSVSNNEVCHRKTPYKALFIQPTANDVPDLPTEEISQNFPIGEFSQKYLKMISNMNQDLMKLLPSTTEQLPPRTMKDSFVSASLPLKSNLQIRERYVGVGGSLRIEVLLADFDFFAVYCGYKHILHPKRAINECPYGASLFTPGAHFIDPILNPHPYCVVTALVDSIYITNNKIKSYEDVRISGHVTYAGSSSMEICIVADQKDDQGVHQKCVEAIFFMVAKDCMGQGLAKVNPLIAETPDEQEFLKKGEFRQKMRKEREQNICKNPPSEEERKIIDDASNKMSTNRNKMKDSVLNTAFICQPQIGYVEENFVHAGVYAEVVDPKTGGVCKSNEFHYTFLIPREAGEEPVPSLHCETDEEAKLYLDSRRYFKKMMEDFPGRSGN
ncbi:unnamed protein product [Orchesella dallaii]|uniref:HotDog ACOT-type domain-containing protein n=1 Tax=Orchesella dallaii TaxID=48710 RepID=A0ABP1QTJ6_9HEXA